MSLLIKSITIQDPQSSHHGSVQDILIKDGQIDRISGSIENRDVEKKIDAHNLYISPSWVDIGTYSGEPGNEHRENFESLQIAAQYGGYGHLVILPNTKPVIDNSSMVRSILSQKELNGVKIWPMAALSSRLEGEDLTELLDLADAGAVAFTDGDKALTSNAFMMKVLEYIKKLDQAVFHQAHDSQLVPGAQMHESALSMQLGLKGWPPISETILMDRDIELLQYTGSRIYWHNISSASAVERVAWAKKQDLEVGAGVGYLHLCYDEEALDSFDGQFKVSPPLRSKSDQNALWEGLKDGLIDYIVSDHKPWEEEKKKLEFPYAAFGAEGLETAFPTFMMQCPYDNALELWIQKTAIAPREILGMPQVRLEEGSHADFTLYTSGDEYTFQKDNIQSLSKNNPNIGKLQKGRIKGSISGNSYYPCSFLD